jgi:hypothetical protein
MCVPIFCVCVVLCVGSVLETGLIPRPRSHSDSVKVQEIEKRLGFNEKAVDT